ncbi:MAG: prolyl oligopeptidase family serine peptidase [Ilumatobacteraceae bacterium]
MSGPPPTDRGDVIEEIHGVAVADPYRWLENSDAPDVAAWVDAQNAHSAAVLAELADRTRWRARVLEQLRRPLVSAVSLRGDTIVSLERAEGADQSVLVVRSLGGGHAPRVLVDVTSGADATAAIDWFEVSPDGSLVAFGTSVGGTERSVLRVVATADGSVHADEIPDTRACSVAWEPDSAGFFYTRYPSGDEYGRIVRHHRLGDPPDADPEVWTELPMRAAWPDVVLSPDGRWLIVHVGVGWSRTDVHVLDRTSGTWSTVIEGVESESHFVVGHDGQSLLGMTTLDASSGRIVKVLLPAGGVSPQEWETVVAERDAVVSVPRVVGDEMWVVASAGGVDVVERRDAAGELLGTVGDDGLVSVVGLSGDRDTGAALVLVDRFESPPEVWRSRTGGDHAGGGGTVQRAWSVDDTSDADLAGLVVDAVSYPSLDGTEIGMFLVHRADVSPLHATATILNGYGGFAISQSPAWSPQIAAWCAAGGLYAVAQLRGGIEHGESWHRAGNRKHKQRVFDDFAAAADWLVAHEMTSRDRLAVVGRSNGGLLVGAALTQRPDLCRAVWCGVPLLDMVRFPRFLIAELWTSEYGDPDVAEEFAWLRAYSPYHHVVDGRPYPAVLLTCATGDSRVHPLHARKMTAALQLATSSAASDRPVLLVEERDAGHGVGKPVHLRAAEVADALTFLADQLGWSVADAS